MREKHTTIRNGKRLLWYSESLWEKAKRLVPYQIDLTEIGEIDQNCWFDSKEPTLREVAAHAIRIQSADLRFPIIFNDDGSLMDGGHRLGKSLILGKKSIMAVRFAEMPEPDAVMDVDA